LIATALIASVAILAAQVPAPEPATDGETEFGLAV